MTNLSSSTATTDLSVVDLFNNISIAAVGPANVENSYAYKKNLVQLLKEKKNSCNHEPWNVNVVLISKISPVEETDGVLEVVGDVNGCDVIIVDDIVDTGKTLVRTVNALKTNGARKVYACITHGLFNANCFDLVEDCEGLTRLFVTNTVGDPSGRFSAYREKMKENNKLHEKKNKIVWISVSNILGEAIRRLHKSQPLSDKLF